MTTSATPRFDSKMFQATLAFYGLPANWARAFTRIFLTNKETGDPLLDEKTGKQKTSLRSCNAPKETVNGNPVWLQVNVPFEGAATFTSNHGTTYPKKAANDEIQTIHNVTLDAEYPPDPDKAIAIGRKLVDYLIVMGIVEADHPIEHSGAGPHIVIPIIPIETTKETAKLWNEAVAKVVKTSIKLEFDRLVEVAGIKMDLQGFDISRVLSPPGTWRPRNPDKDDCEALHQGVLRQWIAPYTDGRYPVRKESAKLTQMIRDTFDQISNPTQWLYDYAATHPSSDRSALFQSLVNATYLKFGEAAVQQTKELINSLSGEKYNGRLDDELKRSLELAMRTSRQSGTGAKSHSGGDDALNRFDADDAGNGDAMNHLFGQVFVYNEAVGWMHYTGTHWQADEGHAKLLKAAIETLRRRRHAAVDVGRENIIKVTASNTQRINGAIACFKTHVVRSIDTFDAEEHLINCKNGVVSLKTGELTPHRVDQYFTYCVPIEHKVSDYTEWIDYLHGIVGGGDEMISYLQLALGYSLTGSTREECLFYVYGPSRSGKGTVAEILLRLLPRPLSTMVDFNSFTAKREGDVSNFDLAELKPSRVVFASESQRNQSLNPAKIKQLTGGDLVRASFKHKNFFTYRPQFKVWMLSNWPVNGDPEDDALWGRVRVIPFPNSYLGKEDKGKKERLKSDEVLTSILYWAVQGAIKWYALGSSGLQTPDYVAKITKSQRDAQDFVQQWLTESCEDDEKAWTPNESVIASYTKWCESNNVTPKKAKSLAQSLQMKGYQTGVVKRQGARTQKGVSGFKITATLWETNPNVTDVTDRNPNVTDSRQSVTQPAEPSEAPSVTDVTDVTGEKVNSQNPYHGADFSVSPVTSVTEDQSVTNSQEVHQDQPTDEATIPDDFTKGDPCAECGCELSCTIGEYEVCPRCNPPKGYHAYSHLIDEMYPRKQNKAEFGKGGR